jgi:rare lipoprotein A
MKKMIACVLLFTCSLGKGSLAMAERGYASFYHDKFHGRTTACGQRFDQSRLTAAHRRLPCGTRVRVTRPDTGQSVVVTINDRGPFVRGRVIDLSKSAARQLRMLSMGVVPVQVTVLDS